VLATALPMQLPARIQSEIASRCTAQAEEEERQQVEHMRQAAHTLERMVNQNAFGDIAMDMKVRLRRYRSLFAFSVESEGETSKHSYRSWHALLRLEQPLQQNTAHHFKVPDSHVQYWEDESDALRPAEGTLLPLYRFSRKAGKRKSVTALAWHPRHADLFAVGYGSFDFNRQRGGGLACYTVKNLAAPEHQFPVDSGTTFILVLLMTSKHCETIAQAVPGRPKRRALQPGA